VSQHAESVGSVRSSGTSSSFNAAGTLLQIIANFNLLRSLNALSVGRLPRRVGCNHTLSLSFSVLSDQLTSDRIAEMRSYDGT